MKDYQVTIDLAKKHLGIEQVDPAIFTADVIKLIRIIESIPAVMPKIAEIKEIYERNEIPMDADAVGLQPIYYPRDQLTKFIEELNLYFEKISNFSA